MDASLLPGLLGAYGSEEEDEAAEPQRHQQAEVPDQPTGTSAGLGGAEALASEARPTTASLSLPISAAPDVMDVSEPAVAITNGTQDLIEETEKGAEAAGPDPFWLPPEIADPPDRKCPTDVQEKVREYILKQELTGNTITSSLKSLSGYKNPDFLQHCVKYDNIDQYGSCYPKDIFDPTNLPAEDFYDRLAYEWEAKKSSQRTSQKTEFVSRGVEHARSVPGGLIPAGIMAATIDARVKAYTASRSSKWDTRR